MKDNLKVELLAPAGSRESFYGAVHAGADAVYLAGDRFGARAYAENFTGESLLECIRYAHLLGRKIYLTVNTLLKDSELEELYDYLLPFYEEGLDAVIVQDLGVFRFIREHFPDLRIHVSTQMTVCSGYGASLLKAMGAERIIPARELGLQELISMKRHADIEIETFVHGAMCYCYSGQCLFSSIAGGRSGNRGRCAQPCRLPYSVGTGAGKSRDCYPLSLKDMCTVERLPMLIEAGIDSFKIEGRMKKPEYAAGVTAIYRRYIDRYYELREKKGAREAAESYRVEKEDLELLSALYVRSGLQDGYYFRRNGRSMITLDSPAYRGSDEDLLTRIREEHILSPLKLPVSLKALFLPGQPAELTVGCGGIAVSVKGAAVEYARKQPVTEENIRKQLGKLGDTSFRAEQIEIRTGADCFYPLKQINELRREAAALLEQRLLLAEGYGEERISVKPDVSSRPPKGKAPSGIPGGYAFLISTLEQFGALARWICAEEPDAPVRIYVDADLICGNWADVAEICGRIPDRCVLYAALPYILRQEEIDLPEALYAKVSSGRLFRGFLVRSVDGLGFLQEKGGKLPCRTDAGVYVWNRYAGRQTAELAEGFCLPYELRASEQRVLLGGFSCEKIVYGRIPMMVTANCVLRTMGQCRKGARKPSGPEADLSSGTGKDTATAAGGYTTGKDTATAAGSSGAWKDMAVLTDRQHRKFPVCVNCAHCVNIIYNSVPLSLYHELSKWRGRADLRLDFTIESAGEVKEILDAFLKGAPFHRKEYTTGHERRGVE